MAVKEQTVSKSNRLADKIKIRKDYIHGKGSIASLSAIHGVPVQTVNSWAQDEKWTRLKLAFDSRDLAKFSSGILNDRADGEQNSSAAGVTQNQLDKVNEALGSCDDADEMLKLAKAKTELQKALTFEQTGQWPGTERKTPARKRPPPHPDPEPTPEPVAECAKVVPPDVVPTILPASHDPNAPNG